jgi:hypothetical protein
LPCRSRSGTASPLPHCQTRLRSRDGSAGSRTSVASECLGAMPMSLYRRTSASKKLDSDMQKCIFVGYPPDYSAWTFYDPVTKQFIISECAEFDERVFPGLSTKETIPNAQLRLLETPASQSAPSNSISLPIAPEDSNTSQTPLPRLHTLPTPRCSYGVAYLQTSCFRRPARASEHGLGSLCMFSL